MKDILVSVLVKVLYLVTLFPLYIVTEAVIAGKEPNLVWLAFSLAYIFLIRFIEMFAKEQE